jgi:hypothetical protein
MTEHRFVELQTDWDASPKRYRGICTCGPQVWAADKDHAWAEMAEHIVQHNPELRRIKEEAAARRLINPIEGATE